MAASSFALCLLFNSDYVLRIKKTGTLRFLFFLPVEAINTVCGTPGVAFYPFLRLLEIWGIKSVRIGFGFGKFFTPVDAVQAAERDLGKLSGADVFGDNRAFEPAAAHDAVAAAVRTSAETGNVTRQLFG